MGFYMVFYRVVYRVLYMVYSRHPRCGGGWFTPRAMRWRPYIYIYIYITIVMLSVLIEVVYIYIINYWPRPCCFHLKVVVASLVNDLAKK